MTKELVTPRTGVGAGFGALVGFMFAGPVGAGVGALIGGGVAHASGDPQKGVLTPKRKLIFTRAMESIKDPDELYKLADAFKNEGLGGEANMLRKRAELRKLPDTTKEKRRAAFRKAMASDKPELIGQVALAFEQEGAVDAGKTLKEHAEAVRAAHAAGKSAKPMTGGSQTAFADKLAKAIIHFGPQSPQAKTAAGNLVQARGKPVSDILVSEVIRVAADALKVEAPKADGPPAKPITIDTTANASDVSEPSSEVISETPSETPSEAPSEAASTLQPTSEGVEASGSPLVESTDAPLEEGSSEVHAEAVSVSTETETKENPHVGK